MNTTPSPAQTPTAREPPVIGTIHAIPLSELHPMPCSPFQVREDAAMVDLIDSVQQYGVLIPAEVRPRPEGGYEIISGVRRKHASELANLESIPAIIRDLDDDEAIIRLVDSNFQRENTLPSERARAFKMRMEAAKRKAGRPRKEEKENAPKISANFRSDDAVGELAGVSGDTVRNLISLTQLVPELIYSDAACSTLVSGPHTTDSSGKISVTGLSAGTVYVKELGHKDSSIHALYTCSGENPQKVVLTAGQTATISFHNVLNTGSVKLVKETNTGENLAGWQIGLYYDADCTQSIDGSPFLTGADGTITVSNLEPGTLYAKEIPTDDPYWEFDTEVRKVTIAVNQTATVTFTNTHALLFLRGRWPGVQVRGGSVRHRGLRYGSLGGDRLTFGGNVFLFFHLLTSFSVSVILHKNLLENFVVIF